MYATVLCSDTFLAVIPCLKILSAASKAVVSTVPLLLDLVVYQEWYMRSAYSGGNVNTSREQWHRVLLCLIFFMEITISTVKVSQERARDMAHVGVFA